MLVLPLLSGAPIALPFATIGQGTRLTTQCSSSSGVVSGKGAGKGGVGLEGVGRGRKRRWL